MQKRELFALLDEQRDAFEIVMHAVNSARRADSKTAVVIAGGPGSGKSVIALSVLGELARQGRTVLHATGSKSFTQTLRRVAGSRAPAVRNLFKYFNSFSGADPNDIECLILDEAHRIRATSVNRYTPRSVRQKARPQIEELCNAARVPVFLLDDHQVVRPGEQGTVKDITSFAASRSIDVIQVDLKDQFRCGGSEQYLVWVQRLLGLIPGGPIDWCGDKSFSVEVSPTPAAMHHDLAVSIERGYGARIAAGYCWPWSDPLDDGSLVADVVIGDWAMPWNLRGDRSVGGAPPAALWATDPAGFGQVGCVYTAQGFEYDHSGVIIGPDLVWRDSAWTTVRSANRDPDFRSLKAVDNHDFDRLVRNVYKVLLTRGMQSVRIYSTDPTTQEFLTSLVP